MRPFSVNRIDHLVLRVRDLEAILAFYVDLLGCPVEQAKESVGLYQLRAGSSLIDIVPVDGKIGRAGGAAPGPDGRNLDHFCLRIDPFDADAIGNYLKANGVESGGVESRCGAEGNGPSIYLKDPEGNVVELKGPPWDSEEN